MDIRTESKLIKRYIQGVLKVSFEEDLTIAIVQGGSITTLIDSTLSTGFLRYDRIGSCYLAYSVDFLIEISKNKVLIYLAVYDDMDLIDQSASSSKKSFLYENYNPNLIFNKTLHIEYFPSDIMLEINNSTETNPGDENDIISDFLALSLFSIHKGSLTTYPESYIDYLRLKYSLPMAWTFIPPSKILYHGISSSKILYGWEPSYLNAPEYLKRVGYGYLISYPYTASNTYFQSVLYSSGDSSFMMLPDSLNKCGAWIYNFTSYEYSLNYIPISQETSSYDYNILPMYKGLLVIVPRDFGLNIVKLIS